MSMALTLVRLRWALTMAALRKSPWQVVGYIIGLLFALGGIVGLVWLAMIVGRSPDMLDFGFMGHDSAAAQAAAYTALVRASTIITAAFGTLFVVIIQLVYIGEGSTLSPRKFALYGIPDRTLSAGLLIAGLSGIPAIAGTIAFALWALAYRWMGPVSVIAAVIAAPLAVMTIMSLCRLIIALATTLVTSNRGRSAFYLIVMVALIGIMQLPNLIVNGGLNSATVGDRDFAELAADLGDAGTRTADVLAWTPLGAAFQLPFDAAAGAWLALLGRLAMLAVTWALCFMGVTWCLRHERLTVGADTSSAVAKGIGAFGWMPDSPSGAVSARLLTYLKRDPRQSLMFVFPVLMVALFALQSRGMTIVVWQSLTWMGLLMLTTEGNGIAYDGGGFTMQVLAGLKGRDDRRGRIRVQAGISVLYLLVLAAGIFAVSGDWRTSEGLATGMACTLVGIGTLLTSLGLAEVVSGLLMYPVPSIDKPFSSPQGRAAASGIFPFVHILGSLLLMLPTGIIALVVGLTVGLDALAWAIGPIGLLNGLVVLIIGTHLGGKILDARAVRIVATLESFASLQK